MTTSAPVLSSDAATILALEDKTPEDGFTFQDYINNFDPDIVAFLPLERNYDHFLAHTEDGVMTKHTTRFFMSDIVRDNSHRGLLYLETVSGDAEQLALTIIPSFFTFTNECGEESYKVVRNLPDGPGKALAHTFFFGSVFVGKTVENYGAAFSQTTSMADQSLEEGDPEVGAHTAFAISTLGLSLLLMGRGIMRMGTPSTPTFHYGPTNLARPNVAVATSISSSTPSSVAVSAELSTSIALQIGVDEKNSSSESERKTKREKQKFVNDSFLARILSLTQGNRTHASLLLEGFGYKLSHKAIGNRILSSKVGSELASFAEIKGYGNQFAKKGLPPPSLTQRLSKTIPTEEEIAAALKVTNGHRKNAARILHRTRTFVERHIAQASDDSPLAEFREGSRPGKITVSNEDLITALTASDGDRELASRLLTAAGKKITAQAIGRRIIAPHAPFELQQFVNRNGRFFPIRPQIAVFLNKI